MKLYHCKEQLKNYYKKISDFSSLEEPDFTQDYLSTPWACPICELNFYLTGLGRLRHQVQCQKTKELMEGGMKCFLTICLPSIQFNFPFCWVII
jgi:hypothetical protein